LGKVLHLRDVP